jgi:hypothetical protein
MRSLLHLVLAIAVGSAIAKPFPEAFPALAGRPAWLDTPDAVFDVRWIRAYSTVSEVRDGVCTVYMLDRVESDLYYAEEQVDACIKSGRLQLHQRVPAGATRIRWYRAAGPDAVNTMRYELYGLRDFRMGGFYYHPDPNGPCHVITARGALALGHELKHCFDGFFHSSSSRWFPSDARR